VTKLIDVECPKCGAKVCYKYGLSNVGKRKVKCIICNRQFVLNSSKTICSGKPKCDLCGSVMYLYRIDENILRFRCSKYPDCKFYKKYRMEEVD
jgi:transposase-like protein